jgi:hypothetical protein
VERIICLSVDASPAIVPDDGAIVREVRRRLRFALQQQRPQALPVAVLGMAFEDFEHNRGSAQVATLWELHPAIVTIP